MDDDLRRLERQAAQGDAEALARLKQERKRLGLPDPEKTPWLNPPEGTNDPGEWTNRCRAWCDELDTGKKWRDYSLRTFIACDECKFTFTYRTSYYSMRASADVKNFGVCCNPDCKRPWSELS